MNRNKLQITLEFTKEEYEGIVWAANKKGMTPEDWCCSVLIEEMERIKKESFQEVKKKVFDEYGDMLKRLADR